MSRTILIMAGGTGSSNFGSGVTRTARALASAEAVTWHSVRKPVP
jgi:hypothetical protein